MSQWGNLVGLVNQNCLATFGIPVVYTPSMETRMELSGTPVELDGIFDEKSEVVSLMGMDGMDAIIPRLVLEIRLSDLGFPPMTGDAVAIYGITYNILEVRSTGNGVAVMILNRQQDQFGF